MTEQESKELKQSIDIHKEMERIFSSPEFDKLFADNLRKICEEDFLYGECFQQLYPPETTPPKRYGYSGEEI